MRDPDPEMVMVLGWGGPAFANFSDLECRIPPIFGNRGMLLASTCLEVCCNRRFLISSMVALRARSSLATSALLCATASWYLSYQ
jgi:hypothetical protein